MGDCWGTSAETLYFKGFFSFQNRFKSRRLNQNTGQPLAVLYFAFGDKEKQRITKTNLRYLLDSLQKFVI